MQKFNLEELIGSLAALFPDDPGRTKQEIKKNLKAVMLTWFHRLDLVSSEEIEVQKKLLARCRSVLASLEARVTALERAQDKENH